MSGEDAGEDKKRRDLVEARNQAEGLVHTTERTLKEAGDKVPAGEREAVEQAVAALKDVLSGEDAGAIKAKTEALAQVSMKIGEAMCKAQGAAGGEAGPQPGGPQAGDGAEGGAGSEKVVVADFEDLGRDAA